MAVSPYCRMAVGVFDDVRIRYGHTAYTACTAIRPYVHDTNQGANTKLTTLISLMRMFIAGPDVSLNGSPTVSPTTAALCGSEPLPPSAPPSMCFLALSHAPPALAMNSASITPVNVAPASMPPSAYSPSSLPTTTGATTAVSPGTIISRKAARVAMSTQRPHAGSWGSAT